MGWIAWSKSARAPAVHASVTPHMQIDTGAMVLEAPLPPDQSAVTLLEVGCLHPEPSLLRLQSIPGEGISLLIAQGTEFFHGLISHTLRARTDHIRITFNWQASDGTGTLSVEHPGDDALFVKELTGCPPLSGALILGALSNMRLSKADPDHTYLAFHKGPLAVGPCPSIEYHTPVLTPYGYAKIGTLKAGDTVITPNGDIVPIIAALRKTAPPLGALAPVRLRAPYFGLQSDVIVSSTQRMIAGGSDVEYTFGRDSVLIPARHLINGTAAIPQPARGLVSYHQLLLPGGEPIIAGNIALESLFIGRLRRRKDQYAHTTLADLPRHVMPEHPQPTGQILKPFEAITLASMRAA